MVVYFQVGEAKYVAADCQGLRYCCKALVIFVATNLKKARSSLASFDTFLPSEIPLIERETNQRQAFMLNFTIWMKSSIIG